MNRKSFLTTSAATLASLALPTIAAPAPTRNWREIIICDIIQPPLRRAVAAHRKAGTLKNGVLDRLVLALSPEHRQIAADGLAAESRRSRNPWLEPGQEFFLDERGNPLVFGYPLYFSKRRSGLLALMPLPGYGPTIPASDVAFVPMRLFMAPVPHSAERGPAYFI